jgi:amino acid transporter
MIMRTHILAQHASGRSFSMATSNELVPAGGEGNGDIDVEQAPIDKLHSNALGLPAVLFLCVAAIAPAASMLFNVPVMASQAGAATPLAFALSAVGILLLGVAVVSFARHLSSAGGFYTWVRHGLGSFAAFQVGWLMLGAYALFEAALQATVGGSLDITLAGLGFHLPGGWVTYAVFLTLIVGILSYLDIKASVWVMAPFALAEVLALVILNTAITLKGGVAGHDLLHTFTPAGTTLKGVAPGGILGIGIAMVLGILAFVGFETGAVYGEEARHPRRTIPIAMFSLLLGLAVLYIWTSYSATIGVGWQHAVDVLGNVNTAPQQYVTLAEVYVGRWLGIALVIFVLTSNFASSFAMHQAMVRYFYSMGREGVLPRVFGKTHYKWRSPYLATCAQSGFTLLVVGFLGLVIQHTNTDGSVTYALGIANGTSWQQTSGIVSFGWLAGIVTMCLILVYLLTNVATPFFARTRGDLRVFPHLIAPAASSLLLLLPLASYILPALPGIGTFFTALGFAPTPFPSNLLPVFVLAWVVCGLLYAAILARRAPERYERLGRIVRGNGE